MSANTAFLRQALAVLRASVDALAVAIEAIEKEVVAPPAPVEEVPCTRGGTVHGRTQDVSGMGDERVELCLECGVELKG